MAGKYWKVVSAIFVLVILFNCSGCSIGTSDEVLASAVSQFATGETTDRFTISDHEQIINDQMELFMTAYYLPDEKELSDDEYIDLMRRLFDPSFDLDTDQTEPTQSTIGSETSPSDTVETSADITLLGDTVSSRDDFKRILYRTLINTETSVEFKVVNGYRLDLSDCINDVYDEIEREDPINGSCVEQWQWWSRGNNYSLFITYKMDVDVLIDMKNSTQDLVDEAIAQIHPSGKTQYEIVDAINDYLCETVEYPDQKPYAPVEYTAYGALNNGSAVCLGYAGATKLLLAACGMECDIESGECNDGELHAWNLVKVDGVWYQLDVCWDDGSRVRHKYFLVDDDYMHKTRHWAETNYPVRSDDRYVA